ncbi:MAG TPA: GNAT family N-acetyltransferase [Bryobacteraceae bacterium]|jgi:CelD/BcsL family acetyltransferase involved in cellulose biosynthesis|nr:GNAT family N-acetyltransferase [Bryobacteraceae bacterium]
MLIAPDRECKVEARARDRAAWPELRALWSELAAPRSIFLSAEWIGTWLEIFGESLRPRLVTFEAAGEPVGVCMITKARPNAAYRIVRRLSINGCGEPTGDTVYSERNDLVCRAGWELPVAASLAHFLEAEDWEEVSLDGFIPGIAYEALKRAFPDGAEEMKRNSFVDLEEIRASGSTYEARLTPGARKHVQRSLRYQSESGELRVSAARDLSGALRMFDELGALSRKRWHEEGKTSVFASPAFVAFHRAFIAKMFSRGGVLLLRVTAGEALAGVVYALVEHGRVCLYQAGYFYTGDKRLSPGTATLAAVVRYCLDHGFRECDFLSGDAQYKESLGTKTRTMAWAVFRRDGIKAWCFEQLKQAKRRFL